MTERTCWQWFKVEGANMLDRLKDLLHEGNIRRVRVEHQGRTVAEFPLTVGVVGAVFAPLLAAVGAVVALLQSCTIYVERPATGAAGPTSHTTPNPDAI